MYRVDLNSDLGESFGNYTIGMDEEILKYVSSANVACGWHAGDAMVMEKTVALAKEFGTAVGAHPGFPDLVGFGRRNMAVTPDEAKAYVRYQLGALMAFCTAHGVKIQHVKPHGALYNMAAVDEKLAIAMCEAVYEVDKDIIFMGLAGSKMITAGQQKVGLALQVRSSAAPRLQRRRNSRIKKASGRSDQGQRSRDQTCDPYGKRRKSRVHQRKRYRDQGRLYLRSRR